MSTTLKKEKKITWCLSTYGELLSQQGLYIRGIRECPWGHKCHNAHSLNEISLSPDIQKWNQKSKEKINLLDIKNNIIRVFNSDKVKVKNPKYISKLNLTSDMYFKDLLDFWFDITCYHRKIDKMLKRGEKSVDGYYKPFDVPKFYLDNEDYIWSLQRTFNICPKHKELCENTEQSFYIKNICVGHHNCKSGVHRNQDLVCIDDMIKGSCDCKSLEEIECEKKIYQDELDEIKLLLHNKDAEFSICLSKSKEKTLRKRFVELTNLIRSIGQRKIHYTEQGLIPLNKRIEEQKKVEPTNILIKINNKKVLKLKK